MKIKIILLIFFLYIISALSFSNNILLDEEKMIYIELISDKGYYTYYCKFSKRKNHFILYDDFY